MGASAPSTRAAPGTGVASSPRSAAEGKGSWFAIQCPRCGYALVQGWTRCIACSARVPPPRMTCPRSRRPRAAAGVIRITSFDDWGAPAGAPPPPQLLHRPPRHHRRPSSSAVAGWLHRRGRRRRRRGAPPDPTTRPGWDPRVADLAAFVEQDRDLRFDHPVEVASLHGRCVHGRDHHDESDITEDDLASARSAGCSAPSGSPRASSTSSTPATR